MLGLQGRDPHSRLSRANPASVWDLFKGVTRMTLCPQAACVNFQQRRPMGLYVVIDNYHWETLPFVGKLAQH